REMGFAFPKEWRQALVESEPEKFALPSASDMRYHWAVVRLDAIDEDEMRALVHDAWAMVVPKKVVDAYLEERTGGNDEREKGRDEGAVPLAQGQDGRGKRGPRLDRGDVAAGPRHCEAAP